MPKKKIYAIIPARGGSKGVPGKNIKPLGGFPLLAYSIVASKLTKSISRTIVSTDSPKIARIAERYGAEIPFLRPAQFARDKSGDWEVLNHAKNWLKKNEGLAPDLFVYLRPVIPLRDPKIMGRAIAYFFKNPGASSLRSAQEMAEPPEKMFRLAKSGFFEGYFPDDSRLEYTNLPRQSFPKGYHPKGYIDIVRTTLLNDQDRTVYGPRVLPLFIPAITEIDLPEDFDYLEYEIATKGSPLLDYLRKNFKNAIVGQK